MGRRREGRETAVQFLFAHDVHEGAGNPSPEEQASFWDLHSATKGVREFAEVLIKGVLQDLPKVDAYIIKSSQNFSLDRIGGVERNILRLGIYELLHTKNLASAIIINEGIEIAKKFCANDSSRFINGMLDRIAREIRPDEPRQKRGKKIEEDVDPADEPTSEAQA
ncbi:MAG: utilization substance protein [Verrucomicrobiaceae bacterium]|nr:utilization substance protein [Verrucomicrobiaceae bacterium]MDB6120865.1 utilization substance protein [Verrucomicrobiaceae bacterium]